MLGVAISLATQLFENNISSVPSSHMGQGQ
jgi:hypothetical protein